MIAIDAAQSALNVRKATSTAFHRVGFRGLKTDASLFDEHFAHGLHDTELHDSELHALGSTDAFASRTQPLRTGGSQRAATHADVLRRLLGPQLAITSAVAEIKFPGWWAPLVTSDFGLLSSNGYWFTANGSVWRVADGALVHQDGHARINFTTDGSLMVSAKTEQHDHRAKILIRDLKTEDTLLTAWEPRGHSLHILAPFTISSAGREVSYIGKMSHGGNIGLGLFSANLNTHETEKIRAVPNTPKILFYTSNDDEIMMVGRECEILKFKSAQEIPPLRRPVHILMNTEARCSPDGELVVFREPSFGIEVRDTVTEALWPLVPPEEDLAQSDLGFQILGNTQQLLVAQRGPKTDSSTMRVLDARTGTLLAQWTLPWPDTSPMNIQSTADGDLVALVSQSDVRFFDPMTGEVPGD